jgi:uroporphyrinogen-III synthase
MSALRGRSVLVTRPRWQAAALCAELEARGAVVVVFPTITIEPVLDGDVREAVDRLESYDWIAFTSANAVTCWMDAMRAAGRAGMPADVRVAAVGAATAAALAGRGVAVAAMPGEYLGAELAGALGPLAGRRVLLPRSDIARADTGHALRAAGAVVDEVLAYRTVTPCHDLATLRLLDRPLDALTFTSPSTVRGFLAGAGERADRLLRNGTIACIGPVTADAARRLGLRVAVEPAEHTAAALVRALESHFTKAPPAPAGVPT